MFLSIYARGRFLPVILLSCALFLLHPQTGFPLSLELLQPAPGETVRTSKPKLRLGADGPLEDVAIIAMLDAMDVSGIVERTATGFSIQPVEPLPQGNHMLQITLLPPDGQVWDFSFAFTIEKQISGELNFSATYDQLLHRKEESTINPDHNFTSDLGSRIVWQSGYLRSELMTTVRAMDRNTPLFLPERKGLDLVNYHFLSQYQKETTELVFEAGDVQVEQSPLTLESTARKGLAGSVRSGNVMMSAFILNSTQYYGVRDKFGLEFDGPTIQGGRTALDLFDGNLSLTATYVDGEEADQNFGIWNQDSGLKSGDVYGLRLQGRFLQGLLDVDGEYDRSRFDKSDMDSLPEQTDEAWRVSLSGSKNSWSWQGLVEQLGANYQVIGNPNLQNDREGVALSGGFAGPNHSLSAQYSIYRTNVDLNPLYSRTQTGTWMLTYTCTRFENLSFGFDLQMVDLDSSHVPVGATATEQTTTSLNGNIQLQRDVWSLGLLASWSELDDQTPADEDSSALSVGLNPALMSAAYSLTTSFRFDRSTQLRSGTDTDNWTSTVDFRGDWLQGRLTGELNATYTRTKTSDSSVKNDSFTASSRIGINPFAASHDTWSLLAGLKGDYTLTKDHLSDTDSEEYAVFLFVSAGLGATF